MSQAKDNESRTPEANDAAFEAELHEILKATGQIVPQSGDEVAQAEALLNQNAIELPSRLRSPPSGSQLIRVPKPPNTGLANTPTAENLARAAREGGEITDDVSERMRRDRIEAERQSKPDA